MIQFGNEITAGTVLVIDAIQSPNFATGVSGWIIRQNGSVEFANATIRGQFVTTGANNSSITIGTTGGTGFGTAFEKLRPPDLPSIASNAIVEAALQALSNQPAGLNSSYLQLEIDAPEWLFASGPPDVRYPVIILRTATWDGLTNPLIYIGFGGGASSPKTALITLDGNTTINGDLSFGDYNNDAGKGFVVGTGATAVGPAAGAIELVTLQLGSTTFKAGRAYSFKVAGGVAASIGPNNVVLRIRKDDGSSPPTGQQLDVYRVSCPNGATTFGSHYEGYFRIGAADVTATLLLTIVGSGAFNATLSGSATSPSSFVVTDVGKANSYNWSAILV